ncbi:hypothetical protein S83_066194, partial [Arachis hypogaea]
SSKNKSHILAFKLTNIRATEHRFFLFDYKIAFQDFNIVSLTSQIHNLKLMSLPLIVLTELELELIFWHFRLIQNEVNEFEELLEKRDRFYEAKMVEMKQFKEVTDEFVVKCRR